MPKNYAIELLKPEIKTYILEHPRTSTKEIAKMFEVWTTTVQSIIREIHNNADWEYTKIVQNAKDIILKGQQKIWESMDNLDVKSYRDLHELSSVLKDMSDISKVAEETTSDNMIIPVNITINYWWENSENKITLPEEEDYIDISDLENKTE